MEWENKSTQEMVESDGAERERGGKEIEKEKERGAESRWKEKSDETLNIKQSMTTSLENNKCVS